MEVADYAHAGSLEARVGGRALAARVRKLVTAEPESSLAHLAAALPDGAGAHALFLAAEQGDCHAIEILREMGDLVAILVANLVTILSPEVVALGGAIGLHETMLERAQAVTASCSMPSCRRATTIAAARLGGDAGLLGATHLVFSGQ
jgi:glucokinase